MKDIAIKEIFIIIIFGLFIWTFSNYSQAAYVSISPSTTSATPGQTVTLTISSDCIGKVNLSSSNGTLSQSSVFVDGTQTVNVVVGNSGTVSVTATPSDMSDANTGEPVSIGASSASITIKTPSNNTSTTSNEQNTPITPSKTTEKSNIATLSNLGIRPNDFSGFSPSKTSYSVTVPNEVESVEVYATKGQSGQKVSGIGTKKLNEGANAVNVVVTAEDGKTTKTYTINITRSTENKEDIKEKEKEEEKETEEPDETFGLKELSIEGLELQPQFQIDIYEYKIQLKEDLEKLNLTTLATEEDVDIEISGNENLKEGENIITIIVKSKDEEKTIAYQIIVNKTLLEEQTNEQSSQENIIMISVICGIIFIIVLIIVVVVIKKHKKEREPSIPYFNLMDNPDEEQLDNIYQKNYVEDESYYEKPEKKKHSKGKRFK